MDEVVGKTTQALIDADMLDNSIIIFTSDVSGFCELVYLQFKAHVARQEVQC